jgi:hypothetical protein
MNNLNKSDIEKVLDEEIKYAKSWSYEIKIEIIIELNMLNINIVSYNSTITINIINKFTKAIKKKLKMQIILIKPINNGIIISYIHQLNSFNPFLIEHIKKVIRK